jgi:DNA-binding NarL/FixJ family response regulator
VLMAMGRKERAEAEARASARSFGDLGATADEQRAIAVSAARAQTSLPGSALPLTSRQVEILGLIADGLSDKEIALRLQLSQHTVHAHVANILNRLELPSRAAAVALATRIGLIE